MKDRLCQLARRGVSPGTTVVAALVLAALMIFFDADQTTCFIALVFLFSLTRRDGACRLFGRNRS